MKFKLPNIAKANTAHIWWETEKGKRKKPTANQLRDCWSPNPKEYPYALCRFPTQVTTVCYKRRKKDGGYGSKDQLFRGESGAPGDLAVKLVVNSNYSMKLDTALVIASTACERCMNILAHKNGLPWGYSPKSPEAKKAKTVCDLCR